VQAAKRGASRARGRGTGRRAAASLAKWGVVALIWGGVFTGLFIAWCAIDLPDVSRLNEIKRRSSVTLLAADGSLIASYGDLYGNTLKLSDLPAYLPQAVIATEDRRFYSHFGIDLLGLARALYVDVRAGRMVQGGSGITQQLAKNVFLTPERSLHRKGQEVLLALWLERHFSKEQILELYLNRVYFGAGTYGVDAAARKYFGKSARDVSLFEAALLAGMLKAPSKYNPLNDKKLAQARATVVLGNMQDAGYIDEMTALAAATATAPSVTGEASGQIAQHFADWALDQVSSYVGYTDQDLVVETTLDPRIERAAEDNVARIMAGADSKMHAGQAALVAMTPEGAVRAMVGGRDYRTSQFNRATQALRQPGSSFKAVVFLTAFENGYAPEDTFVDGPITIGKWRPGNYMDKFYGTVTLREAFARSLNSVAVQLSEQVGRDKVIATARRLGIGSPLTDTPSIALGTSGASVLDMTAAYATFANQGRGVWPYAIEAVTASDGAVLYKRSGSGPGIVASADAVAKMLDVMGAVVDWGTGKRARLDRPVYGKTGTSQNYRDAWFMGVTADLVAGVWVGNDDNSEMEKVTGGSLPVTIWHDFMAQALAQVPPRDVARPQADWLAAAASGAPVDLIDSGNTGGGGDGATTPEDGPANLPEDNGGTTDHAGNPAQLLGLPPSRKSDATLFQEFLKNGAASDKHD